jgi:hypothetical protein
MVNTVYRYPYQERVFHEREALMEKIDALRAYTLTTYFPLLHDADRMLLRWQLDAMESYLRVLCLRLDRFQKDAGDGG